MPKLTIKQFEDTCGSLFRAVKVSEEDIKILTDALLFAGLRGHDTHGIGHLAGYVKGYMGQRSPFAGVKRDAMPRIVKETPGTVTIEADKCIGPKVTMWATELIIEKAKTTGIAAATVTNCVHNGTMAYYMDRIAQAGMIGFGFTCAGNASPPWGGVDRMLGTNPFGMAFPTKNSPPVVIDMATSAVSHGGLAPMLAEGKPFPPGILLDGNGEPTTDPKTYNATSGQKGSVTNLANNHKGYAIQLATEILGGVLPALMVGGEGFTIASYNNPSFLIAINVGFFQDENAFKDKLDTRIKQLKSSKKKPGVEEIYMPGERSYNNQQKYRTAGIPVNEHVWKEIEDLAKELGVKLPEINS
ncbi:MAG: Ldh family oxidoreductase [Dehalococcoidia bacterium]|nr:Ldh family oxidoreductase [Dehalococcoidia bacterium]